jgi:hypothetical protein
MSVFDGNTDIFDAHLAAPMTFATTFTGIGKQGFVFKLDTTEAAALQALLGARTATTVAALRIGLSASASDATGGPETFNLATNDAPIAVVPEPGTGLLSATALIIMGVAYLRWRRKGSIA